MLLASTIGVVLVGVVAVTAWPRGSDSARLGATATTGARPTDVGAIDAGTIGETGPSTVGVTTAKGLPATAAPTTSPVGDAASPPTDVALSSRTVPLSGRVVFPYLTMAESTFPVASSVVFSGPCDGRGPCSMTPLYFGTAFEGQPASFDLVPAPGGYTLRTEFLHVDARTTCMVTVHLELTMTIVTSVPDLRIIGSGQYSPERRSALGGDGVRGCFTDVAVFSFASATLPTPAPPPPD